MDGHEPPDYANAGWQKAGVGDLRPGPVGAVTFAMTHERLSDQCE